MKFSLAWQDQASKSYYGLRGLFAAMAIETLVWVIAFARVKSEPTSQVFLGLSPHRLGVAGFLAIVGVLCLAGCIAIGREKEPWLRKTERFFNNERLPSTLTLVFAALCVGQVILLGFQAESFGRYSEQFDQLRTILWWGALLCGQIAFYLSFFEARQRIRLSRKAVIFGLLGVGMIAVWFITSQEMNGRPSTNWMGYYHVEDFYDASPAELITFFEEMRAGIPPALSFSEIIIGKLTGSTQIVAREFYRLALIVTYLIAAFRFARNIFWGILSSAIALVFMSATISISAQNPEIYDVYYPCYLLLFVFFVQLTQSKHRFSYLAMLWAFLAGLFLSLAELSRPFVLILMPLFLLFGVLSFGRLPRKALVSFLAPILILSGGWHIKLLLFNDGQLFWSNHSGFNLYRAWEEIIEAPELIAEPQTEDNRSRIHSQEHFVNSKLIQRAVFEYLLENPLEGVTYIKDRMITLLLPRTSFFEEPENQGFFPDIYRFVFRIACLLLLVQLIRFAVYFFGNPRIGHFASPQNVLLISTALTVTLLAVGEKGEEARLLLAILPFLAALPTVTPPPSSPC